jgi:hypothetical protein
VIAPEPRSSRGPIAQAYGADRERVIQLLNEAPIGSSIGAAHDGCVLIGFSSERSAGRWGAAAQPVVIR